MNNNTITGGSILNMSSDLSGVICNALEQNESISLFSSSSLLTSNRKSFLQRIMKPWPEIKMVYSASKSKNCINCYISIQIVGSNLFRKVFAEYLCRVLFNYYKIVKSSKKSESGHVICNLSDCECIFQQRNRSK